YRLPRPQGRSASGSQDVGSGRDLFKKFMMMRGMFQQPPSDNVIVISQPSTTTTTTTTPITTTTPSTTTTTTTTTNGTSRALNHNLGRQLNEPQEIAVPTFTGLEDRLDLPVAVEESEPLELETFKQRKQSQQIHLQPLFGQKKFKLRSLPAKNKKKNVNRHQKIHHRHRFIQKKHRHQHQKKQKQQPSPNQHRSSESVVDFIEPYHNDRSPSQTSQSGSESQLRRIWRRFQLAN
ncbi:hypothetical protein KR074_010710, partial [Drosophila pseudoananassae]